MKQKIFILLYLICLAIKISKNLKCDGLEIENCTQCGIGDTSNTCIECEDKHFLFFNNLYCLPCDHPIYGQIGCGGNCDSSRFIETRNVLCNENDCKEGYYNLNGICFKCSDGSYGCKKCEMKSENNEKIFMCKECINNEYYLDNYNRCKHCTKNFCSKCHYTKDYSNIICDKCIDGFYLNFFNQCQECRYPINIPNGKCKICSDDDHDYSTG